MARDRFPLLGAEIGVTKAGSEMFFVMEVSMHTFRMLVSGCGGAGLAVARVAAADSRATVVGLFDPVREQLSTAQAEHPDALAGTDYEHLLQQTEPDTVVVAGPDHLHADQTIAALEHGCHVLVEKPLTTTAADAQRVIEAVSQTGLHVMTDHTMRYVYPFREMVLAARSGVVGTVFFVQGDYIHDMLELYSPQGKNHTPWRIDQENPQNILLGGGCHPLDLMLWTVASPVAEVHCYANKMSAPDFPSDDCYILMLRFDNGVLGKVFVTSGCSGHGMGGGHLAVYGTEGTLWRGKLYRHDGDPIALEETGSGNAVVAGHGWGGAVPAYFDLLEGKIENPISARAGARVVAVCDAALEAIRTGLPQRPVQF